MNFFGIRRKERKEDLLEDDIPKRGFFVFLDVYFSRFFKFMGINCLMLAANIFYIAFLFYISPLNAESVSGLGNIVFETPALRVHFDMFLRVIFALFIVLFWGSGPISAGVAYIFRCFAAREHSWILSDFKDKLAENAKQGFVLLLADIFIIIVFPIVFRFYYQSYVSSGAAFNLVIIGVLSVFLIFYTFMHYFMYQMMVRFECKIKEIYKNALILTVMKFPVLIIVSIIALAFFIIPIYTLELYSFLLFGLVLMSLIRFILEFYASRVIEDVIEPEEGKEKIIDTDRKWH